MHLYSSICQSGQLWSDHFKAAKPKGFVCKKNLKRKEKLSPQNNVLSENISAFLFTPLKTEKRRISLKKWQGSLTVEAALVLPLFLFFMIAVLQYGVVMETAVKFGTALAETGKSMAVAAYATEYGSESDEGAGLVVSALSAAYAKQKIMAKAGNTSAVKNTNMALSSFLQEDDRIDLVLTYQMRTPIAGVRLPGNFFLQRASVRAWTGRRSGNGSGEESEEKAENDGCVYVTETGVVYHEDPECTHLKLSIREVERDAIGTLRNRSGAKYHCCERCGAGNGDSVYITNEGNRYHSSLSCSGLKRTVTQVSREDCKLRACSKCGKK